MPGWAVALLIFTLLAIGCAGGAIWYVARTRGQVEEMFEEQYNSLPEGPEAGAAAGAVGAGGSLQQAPGGGFVGGKGGRAMRAPPKFPSSTAELSAMLPELPHWLGNLLQPPQAHAHVRIPMEAPQQPGSSGDEI